MTLSDIHVHNKQTPAVPNLPDAKCWQANKDFFKYFFYYTLYVPTKI